MEYLERFSSSFEIFKILDLRFGIDHHNCMDEIEWRRKSQNPELRDELSLRQ